MIGRTCNGQVTIDAHDAVAVMEHKFTQISKYSAHLRKAIRGRGCSSIH
jgi:hypothetical protein